MRRTSEKSKTCIQLQIESKEIRRKHLHTAIVCTIIIFSEVCEYKIDRCVCKLNIYLDLESQVIFHQARLALENACA